MWEKPEIKICNFIIYKKDLHRHNYSLINKQKLVEVGVVYSCIYIKFKRIQF